MPPTSFQLGYGYIHDRISYPHDCLVALQPRGMSSAARWGMLDASDMAMKTKKWRERARYLDIVRGTRLGTLGYLPVEIRHMIWKNFFVFGRCCNHKEERAQRQVAADLPREPQIFWMDQPGGTSSDHPSSSNGYHFVERHGDKSIIFSLQGRSGGSEDSEKGALFRWYRLQGPQDASETIREEMETLFFLAHQFTFKHPFDLISFCELLPLVCRDNLRHVHIWLCYPDWPWGFCPWAPNTLINDGEYEALIEAWKDSVRELPETVSTVLVKLGEMDVAKRQLVMLRTIAESIRVVAKQAKITSCSEGHHGRLSDENMVAYQAVLDDVMKHSC